MDNSELYESDFSDENDYSDDPSSSVLSEETERETLRKTKSPKKVKSPKKIESEISPESIIESREEKILQSVSEDICIEDESVILLDGKSTKITLPYLKGDNAKTTSKGKIFTGKSITVISKRPVYEHMIRAAEGNYINGSSSVYMLKGGRSVVFHPIGRSWYADR